MHDGGGDRSKTVKALPYIIDGLRQRGYKFVSVTELLNLKDQELVSRVRVRGQRVALFTDPCYS
jgi:hypothetical protein